MRTGLMLLIMVPACAGCVVPRQQYDAVQREKRRLEDTRANLVREKERLGAEKAALEADIAKINIDVAKWEQRAVDLEESNDQFNAIIKEMTEKSTEIGKQWSECKAMTFEAKYKTTEKETKRIQGKYDDLQKQHRDLQSKIEELKKAKAAAEEKAAAAAREEESADEDDVTPSATADVEDGEETEKEGVGTPASNAGLDISGSEEAD
ncbi:MAG: hypothetical protein P8123_09150 [bacterium]